MSLVQQRASTAPCLRSLGQGSLCGTALQRVFLLATHDTDSLHVVGLSGYAADELAVRVRSISTIGKQISKGASAREHGVGDLPISVVDDNSGPQIRCEARVLVVRHPLTVRVGRGLAGFALARAARVKDGLDLCG